MPTSDEVQLRVPFAPSSVALVRRRLLAWVSAHQPPLPCGEDARIVASELVSNAVRHAHPLVGGGLLVTWGLTGRTTDELHIAVTDGGSVTDPELADVDASSLSGRGLHIVEQLSSRWWVDHDGSHTTVHALLTV